jgi:hypothetical protein
MSTPITSQSTATAAGAQAVSRPAAVSSSVFPLVALLGYVAFLITGFGTTLGPWRPIPLYVFFGFLLYLLQASVIQARSLPQIAYAALATLFALLYAADVVFNTSGKGHLTRAPLTYVVINFLLYAVLVVDALRRRPELLQGAAGAGAGRAARRHPLSPITLATDFAELAIIAYIAEILVNLLRAGHPAYVTIDLNRTLGLHLPARIAALQDFDSAVALAATALALLFLGIVSGLPGGGDATPGATRVTGFEAVVGRIFRTSIREVLDSLRLVLGPIVFIGVGLILAALSVQIAQFFQTAQSSTDVFDLLNPFSPTSLARYGAGLLTLGLVAGAVASFLISVAIVDHSLDAIRRALRLVGIAGQTGLLSLAFFFFSLAFVNAVLVFIGLTRVEPFQVSAIALLALAVWGAFAAVESLRPGAAAKTQ